MRIRTQSLRIIAVALLLPMAGMAMMQLASSGDRALNDYIRGHADKSMPYSQISESDRTAILQILEDTKPDFVAR